MCEHVYICVNINASVLVSGADCVLGTVEIEGGKNRRNKHTVGSILASGNPHGVVDI